MGREERGLGGLHGPLLQVVALLVGRIGGASLAARRQGHPHLGDHDRVELVSVGLRLAPVRFDALVASGQEPGGPRPREAAAVAAAGPVLALPRRPAVAILELEIGLAAGGVARLAHATSREHRADGLRARGKVAPGPVGPHPIPRSGRGAVGVDVVSIDDQRREPGDPEPHGLLLGGDEDRARARALLRGAPRLADALGDRHGGRERGRDVEHAAHGRSLGELVQLPLGRVRGERGRRRGRGRGPGPGEGFARAGDEVRAPDGGAEQAAEAVLEGARVLAADLVGELVEHGAGGLGEAAWAEELGGDDDVIAEVLSLHGRALRVEDLEGLVDRFLPEERRVELGAGLDAGALGRRGRAGLQIERVAVARGRHSQRGEARERDAVALPLGHRGQPVPVAAGAGEPAGGPVEAELALGGDVEEGVEHLVAVLPLRHQRHQDRVEPLGREARGDDAGELVGDDLTAIAVTFELVHRRVAREREGHDEAALPPVAHLAAHLAAVIELAQVAQRRDVDRHGARLVLAEQLAELGVVGVEEEVARLGEGGEAGVAAPVEPDEGSARLGRRVGQAVAELVAERDRVEEDLDLGAARSGAHREPEVAHPDQRADLEALAEAAGRGAVVLGGGAEVGEQVEVELRRTADDERARRVVALDGDLAKVGVTVEEVLEDVTREGRERPLDTVRFEDGQPDDAGLGDARRHPIGLSRRARLDQRVVLGSRANVGACSSTTTSRNTSRSRTCTRSRRGLGARPS